MMGKIEGKGRLGRRKMAWLFNIKEWFVIKAADFIKPALQNGHRSGAMEGAVGLLV